MNKQIYKNFSYTKNLKHSTFFEFSHISYATSLILNVIHHFQLLFIVWTNSNLIIYAKNRVDSFYLSKLLSYFLFISNPQDIQIDSDHLAKAIISLVIILLTTAYPLTLIIRLIKRETYPIGMALSYYFVKYSSLFPMAIISFNFCLQVFLSFLEKFQSENIYLLPMMLLCVGIALLVIGAGIMLILQVPTKTQDPFSRVDNRFVFSTLLHKVILSSLMIICSWMNSLEENSTIWILTIINLIASIHSVSSLVLKGSFVHIDITYYTSYLQAAVLALGIANMIALIEINFYFVTPTKIFFEFLIMYVFISRIIRSKIDELKMSEIKLNLDSRLNNNWTNIKLLNYFKKEKERQKENVSFEDPNSYFLLTLHKQAFISNTFLKQIMQNYDLHTRLAAAYLCMHEFNDVYNCYNICQSLLFSYEASFSIRVGAFYLLNRIETSFDAIKKQEGNAKVRDYFCFQEHYGEFENKILSFLDVYVRLFKLLQEKKPCLHNISKFSVELQEKLVVIKIYWSMIQDIYTKIPIFFLCLYAITLEKLMIEPAESALVGKILKNIINANRKDKKVSRPFDNQRKISLFISIENNSYGKLLNFSRSIYQLGFSPSELLEKNFTSLFPGALHNYCESLLRRIQNVEYTMEQRNEKFIYFLHKRGYLIPCMIDYNFFINESLGLGLGILIEPLKNYEETLMIDNSNNIMGATFNFNMVLENKNKLLSTSLEILEDFWRTKAEEISHQDKTYTLFTPRGRKRGNHLGYTLKRKNLQFGDTTVDVIQIGENENNEIHKGDIQSTIIVESVDLLEIASEYINDFAEKSQKIKENAKSVAFATKKDLTYMFESDEEEEDDQVKESSHSRNENERKLKIEEKRIGIQSITSSTRSENSPRNIFFLFDSMQKQLKFYKFAYSHFLYIFFLIFLVLFATSILISYLNGINTYDEVKNKIQLMVNFNKRDMAILNTASTIWSHDYVERYLADFLPPATTSSYLIGTQMLGLSLIEPAVKISNFVQQTLNSLDDYELKKKIYTENIETFYNMNMGIIDYNSSQVLDNIKATSEILSMMNSCIRRLQNSGSQITAIKNQIYSEVYNDYLIQNEQIQIYIYLIQVQRRNNIILNEIFNFV